MEPFDSSMKDWEIQKRLWASVTGKILSLHYSDSFCLLCTNRKPQCFKHIYGLVCLIQFFHISLN